ncbi:MAG: glycosyltransferase family 39 protein [Nitrospinae bacterium]|nr:glycosyltransferase family 39 protein [Nitrospinota bacterium]
MKNYDDAYYAQKAKEIYESGDLWVVTIAGVPDFANPPLPFWLMALAYSIFGVSSFSAIFPSALFGMGIVVLTYRLADHCFKDSWVAFVSALVLIFPGIFLDASRRAMVDIPLAFFVTLAVFAFLKAKTNKPWYLVFGLATAGGILSKGVLGIFPLVIAYSFLLLIHQWKEVVNPFLVIGTLLALILGFIWHWINWLEFGQLFIDVHFGALYLSGDCGSGFRCNFMGYFEDLFENYWPWLPFALIGLYKFCKRGFFEKEENSLFLFLWPTLVFVILSTSSNQTIRYLFMVFPALSIIVAKTLHDWLGSTWKERVVGGLVGIACLTTLFVNSTPLQVKVTLKESSKGVRQLASVIKLNVPENEKIGNFNLDFWRPKHAMLFYSDRDMEPPVNKKELLRQSKQNPRKMWLSSTAEFKTLKAQAPGQVYLIQANSKYAFFTSFQNRDFVLYDFSGMKIPNVK